MGVWNFVKEAGERIVENAKAAARFGPADKPAASTPAQSSPGKTDGKDAGEAIADYIRAQSLDVSELKVEVHQGDSARCFLCQGYCQVGGGDGLSAPTLWRHNCDQLTRRRRRSGQQSHGTLKCIAPLKGNIHGML